MHDGHSSTATLLASRRLRFASGHCRLDVAVIDEGRWRTVEGHVRLDDVVQVVHERLGDSRSTTVDRCGYFCLLRVPRGLGRLVLVTSDRRRLPTDWTMF